MSIAAAARISGAVTAVLASQLGCTPTLILPTGDASPSDVARPIDAVSSPDVVTAPDAVSSPDVVTAPDAVSSLDVVTAPDAVSSPDVVTAPDAVSSPDVVTAPDVVSARDVLSSPDVVCGAGAVNCDGEASNGCEALTATDPRNCGGCGITCGGAAVCAAGACVCNASTCAGRCTDLGTDGSNCGACGHACPAGVACASGRCGAMACAPGLTLCGARCANTQTDRASCGACDRACGAGEVCARGSCAPTPWQRRYGGGGDDGVNAVVRDADGNLYVGGRFNSSINLGGTTYTGSGRGWVAKLSPTGDVLWSLLAGGAVYDLALDPAGQLYAVGSFNGSTTVGARMLSTAGAYDWFAASVTPAGAVRWAVRQGGTSDDTASRVSVDAAGRVWVGGHFSTVTNFDGQAISARGNLDGFVAQLASADGAPLRFAQLAGTAYDIVSGLAAEPTEGATVYLRFGSSAVVGTTTITGTAVCAALLRLAPDLSLRWSTVLTAASNLDASALARDAAGNLYVSGEYAVGPVRVGGSSFGAGTFNGFVASVGPDGAYRWGVTAADSSTASSSSVVAGSLSVAPDGAVFVEGWAQAPDLTVGTLPIALPAGRVRWLAGISPTGTVTSGRVITTLLNVASMELSAGLADMVFVGSATGPGTFDGADFPATTSADAFIVRAPR